MPRNQSNTSRLSYEKIMRPGAREGMYQKIILCLEWKMDATSYEIAAWAKVKPDKVWKRISELRRDDVIFDTGLRRPSPDGNDAMVYAILSRRSEYSNVKPPERFNPDEKHVSDYAAVLIQKGENSKKEKNLIISQRLEQSDLFK